MNMQVWNPFQEFENLLDRYSRSGGPSQRLNTNMAPADWAPSVDIEEDDDKYTIKADLPGVDKKDIDVKFEAGVLTIRGEKKTESETGKGTRRHRTERFYGSFARSFALPDAIRVDDLNATYKDGVLSMAIPKEEKAKPKAINIKVS